MILEKHWVLQYAFNILGSIKMEEYILKLQDLSFEQESAGECVWFPLA